MTESRSHGHGIPRLPESAITPSKIPTLGSTEKVALEMITRFIFAVSMPIAFPARYARAINTTHNSATNATMPPQMRYIGALLSFSRMFIDKTPLAA